MKLLSCDAVTGITGVTIAETHQAPVFGRQGLLRWTTYPFEDFYWRKPLLGVDSQELCPNLIHPSQRKPAERRAPDHQDPNGDLDSLEMDVDKLNSGPRSCLLELLGSPP